MNLRPSKDNWVGLSREQTDPGYLQFQTSYHGIRAGVYNLLTYYRRHKLQTVGSIIQRWAPPTDNNPTEIYAQVVAKALGVGVDDRISLENRETMLRLVETMIGVECGRQPFSREEIRIAMDTAYASHVCPPEPEDSVVRPPPVQEPSLPPVEPPSPPPPAPPEKPSIPPLVDQPSAAPTRKLVVGGTVGAITFVIMILWNKYVPNNPIPAEYAEEIAGLLVLVATLVTQYFVRNRATDIPPGPVSPEKKDP
jgi:hypothetical protein